MDFSTSVESGIRVNALDKRKFIGKKIGQDNKNKSKESFSQIMMKSPL